MTSYVFAGGGVNIGEHFNSPINSFGELLSVFLPNVYILAGVVLFILLLAGGFTYILNAGKGEKEGTAKGGKMITAAITGFVIIIGSYWIIQIIRTVTGYNILTPPGV